MSYSSFQSEKTYLSHEGVYFETHGGNTSRNRCRIMQDAHTSPIKRWSRTSLASAESQTSLCVVHVEMTATLADPQRSKTSFLGLLLFPWCRTKLYTYQWGWHQAVEMEEPMSKSDSPGNLEKDEEADLSGWEHCRVAYGSGMYDGEEDS
jgi:hypothetical protein